MFRKTYMQIDLDILSNNVKNIISKYHDYKYYIAMIKSNAYTFGMYIINTLIDSGINYLAVSSLDEALVVRKYSKEIGVLCTEIIDEDCLDEALKNNITLTIESLDYLKKIKDKCKVHVKIDSGMNRLGVKTKKEFNEIFKYIKEHNNIYLEGIYTHFATPGINDPYYDKQLTKFRKITSDIDLSTIDIVHLSSSFMLLNHPRIKEENAFRIGTLLYGYDVSLEEYGNSFTSKLRQARDNYLIKKNNISPVLRDTNIDVKPCMSIYTNVMSIRDFKSGDVLGYGYNRIFKDMKIAVLPIGHEDGIGTNNKNRYVLINNKKYNVIGNTCMCMMFVDVDDSVKVGDKATILGGELTLGYLARLKGEAIQETLVSLGNRMKRVYIKEGKIVKVL